MDWYLGIDVGGTKVALRAESETGTVEELTFAWGPSLGAARDMARLATHIDQLGGRIGLPFRAVGVAMPATVGSDERITTWPSRPTWAGLELGAALRDLFPDTAVAWADDGDLAALVEAREMGCHDALYLGVGTGVGGGLLVGGALFPGPSRGGFEIGHVIVELDGPPCSCGRRGCLQSVASGPATLARAARLRGAPVAFAELRRGLGEHQLWADAAVERTCRALGASIASVEELAHPRLAVIGGGFAAGLPGFVDRVAAHLAGCVRPRQCVPPVVRARLGGLSSLHGAVLYARRL